MLSLNITIYHISAYHLLSISGTYRTLASYQQSVLCSSCWNFLACLSFQPKDSRITSQWLLSILNWWQSVARSLFQFSRRDREFLSFNLMFETRTRISFSQSRASRRVREFLFSISGFETRTRIEIMTILARIFENIRMFYTHLKKSHLILKIYFFCRDIAIFGELKSFHYWVGPVLYLELFWAWPVKKTTLYL